MLYHCRIIVDVIRLMTDVVEGRNEFEEGEFLSTFKLFASVQ